MLSSDSKLNLELFVDLLDFYDLLDEDLSSLLNFGEDANLGSNSSD